MTTDGGRALVLGGGGVAGIACEAGLITGLAAHGVDLTTADLIVGTSAGSVVGAHVAHGADLSEAVQRLAARSTGGGPGTAPRNTDLNAVLEAFAILYDTSLDPQEARAKVEELTRRDEVTVHFIGQLQSNKVAHVAAYADVVQSVDRAKIVRALDRAAD